MQAESNGLAADRRPSRVALVLSGLALVAIGALAAVLILRSSSDAPGADDHLYGIAASSLEDADVKKMKVAGVRSVRFLLSWSVVEQQPGSYDWTRIDRLVGQLTSQGIQPVPFVYGSPSWLTSNVAKPPLESARARAAWVAFLKAAVDRYGPDGSFWRRVKRFGSVVEPVPITAWQIWNEPNLPNYFVAESPARAYAELLRISRDAITARDPSAEIVLAGMPGYGKPDTAWEFLDELYQQPGFEGSFDAVALHPYARTVAQLRLEVEKLRATMVEQGAANTPLWLTELGWGSGEPNRFGLNKGLEGQAQLLEESFRLIEDNRHQWRVQRLFWFDWRDPPPGTPQPCSFCATAGLLASNGFPKPSWTVYTTFATGAAE